MLSLPSSSSSPSSVSPKKYDVFLSFRGEDTRKNFTDHLYAALKSNAIFTFMDEERLKAGEAIAPKLFKAIQESWCSIIILSKTYAFSGWCLEELAEIVKQRNEGGHKIFPIFYDVDPSDLRKQNGRVAEAFAKHEERYKENKDKTQRWRSALTEVANVKGWHLKDGPESELIEKIVKTVSANLPQTYSGVSDKSESLLGINSRSEEWLSKININAGICGMGGIGKTTLARDGKEEKAGKENNGGNRRWSKNEEINKTTANALRTNLEQVLAAALVKVDRTRGVGLKAAASADEVDDAQSCCGSSWEVERRTLAAEGGEIKLINDNNNYNEKSSSSRLCKNCRKKGSCMLLLPCRHLCLCTDCEVSLPICPICKSLKNASVCVYMS